MDSAGFSPGRNRGPLKGVRQAQKSSVGRAVVSPPRNRGRMIPRRCEPRQHASLSKRPVRTPGAWVATVAVSARRERSPKIQRRDWSQRATPCIRPTTEEPAPKGVEPAGAVQGHDFSRLQSWVADETSPGIMTPGGIDGGMRVGIVGCGYIGIELGRQLSDTGHQVVGVRRSSDGVERIQAAGFEGIQADVTDPATLDRVPSVDAVVYAVSTGGRDVDSARAAYVEGQSMAIESFSSRETPPSRWVYTGSTGVYGDQHGGWVDEQTPLNPESDRSRVLCRAEAVARDTAAECGMDWTVVRFGGLYGPDRFRVDRYLSGPVTEGFLNLLHRDDAAGVVSFLLTRNLANNEVVVAVDDEPVNRPDLAAWLAERCDRQPPESITLTERLSEVDDPARRRRIRADKRCSNQKLRELGYEFEYPTFREGYQAVVSPRGSAGG